MIRLFVACVISWAVCACSRPEVEHPKIFPTANITIAQVRSMADAGYHIVERDLTITGHVASSDSTGNFFRSMVIVDPSGGAELLSGLYDNYLTIPVGTPLAVRLQGLAIDTDGGVLRVGLPSTSGTSPTPQPFGSAPLWRQFVTMGDNIQKVEPTPFNPGEEFTHLLGQFVRIEHVTLADHCTSTWGGIRPFRDIEGDTLWVETNPYATFAHDTIPTTPLTLHGILYLRNSRPRIVPIKGI
ncbi:MAG: hypothetical protein J6K81_06180 [Rikenellaceae bacterium]|nr:hypothetical protein [Rikenellaceae bacterium]